MTPAFQLSEVMQAKEACPAFLAPSCPFGQFPPAFWYQADDGWDKSKARRLDVLANSAVVPLGGPRPVELLLLPAGASPVPKAWASYGRDLGENKVPQKLSTKHFSPYDMTLPWSTLRAELPDFAAATTTSRSSWKASIKP